MTKHIGVSPVDAAMEERLGLREKNITLFEAQQITSMFCKGFTLRPVTVKVKATRSKSVRHTFGKYWQSVGTREAVLAMYSPGGNNVGTLIHELAHHLQRTRTPNEAGHHGPSFKKAHRESLVWIAQFERPNPVIRR